MLHPNKKIEISRPLSIGNKNEILNYIQNEKFEQSLIDNLVDIGENLKNK